MKLRLANPGDIEVLKKWDANQQVIAARGADETLDWDIEIPRSVDWREILIAEIDGRPIGVIIIIDPEREETHYWGDVEPNLRAIDIWIGEESDLNRGYGTQIMRLALKNCFSNPRIKGILVDPLVSNTGAIRFYERLGFKRVGRHRFGSDACYIYRLDRRAWHSVTALP